MAVILSKGRWVKFQLYIHWKPGESCHNANWCPFYKHGLTLIPAWISYYTHYNVWDEITYPFLNFNGATGGQAVSSDEVLWELYVFSVSGHIELTLVQTTMETTSSYTEVENNG